MLAGSASAASNPALCGIAAVSCDKAAKLAELSKQWSMQSRSEPANKLLQDLGTASDASADGELFWSNSFAILVNVLSAASEAPETVEMAKLLNLIWSSKSLRLACLNGTVGSEGLLKTLVAENKTDNICGRCGTKGHYALTCVKAMGNNNVPAKQAAKGNTAGGYNYGQYAPNAGSR